MGIFATLKTVNQYEYTPDVHRAWVTALSKFILLALPLHGLQPHQEMKLVPIKN